MSARNIWSVFLWFGLTWIVWLGCTWFACEWILYDFGRAFFPLALGSTAPFAFGFFGLGLWLILKRGKDGESRKEAPLSPLQLPATRWQELPPNGK